MTDTAEPAIRNLTASTEPSVLLEVADRVAVITINRPRRRNAIDHPTAVALAAALDELDARDGITVGVLTGAGGTFCAGLDLKAVSAGEPRPIVEGRGGFGIVRRPPDKPLIAAVEGHAVGGGFEIALACDLILAAARELAGWIALNAPLAVRAAKQVALQTDGLPDDEAFDYQEAIVDPVRRSADAAEGARAFAEKRRPQWSGRYSGRRSRVSSG